MALFRRPGRCADTGYACINLMISVIYPAPFTLPSTGKARKTIFPKAGALHLFYRRT